MIGKVCCFFASIRSSIPLTHFFSNKSAREDFDTLNPAAFFDFEGKLIFWRNVDGNGAAGKYAAGDHQRRDLGEDFVLYEPAERAGAVVRVVSLFGKIRVDRGVDGERYVFACEALHHLFNLYADYLAHRLRREDIKDNYFVDAVEELGAEVVFERLLDLFFSYDVILHIALTSRGKAELFHLVDVLRAYVARHDDNGIAEVDPTAFGVGERPRVEHLHNDVEHLRVRLLYLVKQQNRVRAVSHELGQRSALLVSHIAWRRADDFAYGVLLHVLGHIDADERLFVVEHKFGKRFSKLGLAHTGGPQKHK